MMPDCQLKDELIVDPAIDECTAADHEPAYRQDGRRMQGNPGGIILATGVDMALEPEGMGRGVGHCT